MQLYRNLFSNNHSYFQSLLLVLSCVLVFPSIAQAKAAREIATLMVSIDKSNLVTSPSTNGSILQQLNLGESLIELDRKKDWINVKLHNKTISGWIATKNVTRLTPKKRRNTGLTISLASQGYENGILFEGSASNHAQKLYFQVPQDISLRQSKLRVHYRFSPLLNEHSNLRIYINNSPRKAISLKGDVDSGWVSINLLPSDLKRRYVEVEFKSTMLISDNRCFDERISGAYLQILPDTSLQWRLAENISSIRSYWQLLPKQVSISLPQGQIDETLFRNTLKLVRQLQHNGREVRFVRLPEMGHIVIASHQQVREWMEAEFDNIDNRYLNQIAEEKNLSLINIPNQQFLALWHTDNNSSYGFLSDFWRPLSSAKNYQVQAVQLQDNLTEDAYSITLNQLGLDTNVRHMSDQVSWTTNINPSELPPGHRLHKVRIQLIAAPASSSDKPVIFYAYLNDVLINVIRLEDTGLNQEIVLTLPQRQLKLINNLRFVAQRDLSDFSQNCTGKPISFPIQIKPDSTIETVIDDTLPEQFSLLPNYMSTGYDIFLPQKYLEYPEKVISYLSSIMNDMDFMNMPNLLHFYQPNETIIPESPFLLFGHAKISLDKQNVHFDKGRIKVINQQGTVLLQISALPKITIAQIVRTGSIYGLWISPPSSHQLARIKNLSLSKDDVAFADQNGTIMSLDSTQPGLTRVTYPDKLTWFEAFGEYRFWFFAMGWILLTSLIIYLYRLSKAHLKK